MTRWEKVLLGLYLWDGVLRGGFEWSRCLVLCWPDVGFDYGVGHLADEYEALGP